MHDKEHWTRRPIEEIKATAREMHGICRNGECPVVIDASSGCPVMELCRKSCADISEEDWARWLQAEIGGSFTHI